jgi:(p)ppGpp synthase/HD superfamily hydrolase
MPIPPDLSPRKTPCSDCADFGNGLECTMNCGPVINPNITVAQSRVIGTRKRMVFADKPQMMLGEVFRIAVDVHGNQVDRAGRPYLFHVMRVAMAMGDDYEIATALLHDTVEDGRAPAWKTNAKIGWLCGERVQNAVAALTHNPGDDYMEYVRRLSTNPLARKVKLADLQDNMNEQRLRLLPPADADRLRKKYREAWNFLMGIA